MKFHEISLRLALVALAFLFAVACQVSARQEQPGCYGGRGQQSADIAGFTIKVFRHIQAYGKEQEAECISEVRSAAGKLVFSAEDHGLQILPISGADINGDGVPDVVIEGYTGGAHCCWNYWILSLGARPRLLFHLYNERDADFAKEQCGSILIATLDGRFDYFDGLSHAATPFPPLYFRLEGQRLVDVSAEFWPRYETEIRKARERISAEEISSFRANWLKDRSRNPFEDTRAKVLTIVLAYLYGGRLAEAWQALYEMWPPSDQQRIKRLILETRASGLPQRRENKKWR